MPARALCLVLHGGLPGASSTLRTESSRKSRPSYNCHLLLPDRDAEAQETTHTAADHRLTAPARAVAALPARRADARPTFRVPGSAARKTKTSDCQVQLALRQDRSLPVAPQAPWPCFLSALPVQQGWGTVRENCHLATSSQNTPGPGGRSASATAETRVRVCARTRSDPCGRTPTDAHGRIPQPHTQPRGSRQPTRPHAHTPTHTRVPARMGLQSPSTWVACATCMRTPWGSGATKRSARRRQPASGWWALGSQRD